MSAEVFDLIELRRGYHYSELHFQLACAMVGLDMQNWAIRVLERRFGKIPRKVYRQSLHVRESKLVEMVAHASTSPTVAAFYEWLRSLDAA